MVGNLNCDIDKQKVGGDGTKPHIVSKPLYKIKRDMLWILHEHMSTFPFALMELAEAEEHLSSERGMEIIDATELSISFSANNCWTMDSYGNSIDKMVLLNTQFVAMKYCCALSTSSLAYFLRAANE